MFAPAMCLLTEELCTPVDSLSGPPPARPEMPGIRRWNLGAGRSARSRVQGGAGLDGGGLDRARLDDDVAVLLPDRIARQTLRTAVPLAVGEAEPPSVIAADQRLAI